MNAASVLVIFDFDKTLVAKDSFRVFTNLCARGPIDIAILYLYAVLARLRLISNTRYKELALRRVWRSLDETRRAEKLAQVKDALRRLTVDAVVDELRAHAENGDRVVVITASPALYVREIVGELVPEAAVHGSEIHEHSGTLVVDNLFGARKADLAGDLIDEAQADEVHVYTDHRHDLDLMKLASRVTLVRPDRATVAAAETAGIEFEVLVP